MENAINFSSPRSVAFKKRSPVLDRRISKKLSSLKESIFFKEFSKELTQRFPFFNVTLLKVLGEMPSTGETHLRKMVMDGKWISDFNQIEIFDGEPTSQMMKNQIPYFNNFLPQPILYFPISENSRVVFMIKITAVNESQKFSEVDIQWLEDFIKSNHQGIQNINLLFLAQQISWTLEQKLKEKIIQDKELNKIKYEVLIENNFSEAFDGCDQWHVNSVMNELSQLISKKPQIIQIEGENFSGRSSIAKYLHQKISTPYSSLFKVDCEKLRQQNDKSMLDFDYLFQQVGKGGVYFENIHLLSNLGQKLLFEEFLKQEKSLRNSNLTLAQSQRYFASSSIPLFDLVLKRQFHEGLYFFFNQGPQIKISSLSQRIATEGLDDILTLIVDEFNQIYGKNWGPEDILDKHKMLLKKYSWPNNLKEFKSSVFHILTHKQLPKNLKIFCDSLEVKNPQWDQEENLDDIQKLDLVERLYIEKTLKRLKGNKTTTALKLGITVKTLYNKLHIYGII
jgi:DNA-binding NtrC family response regulator